MPQTSRPDADVANDGWAPTPVYAQLNEPLPDDSTLVTSPFLPPSRTFVVHLAPLSPPIAGLVEDAARPHSLVVRLDGTPGTWAVFALLNTIDGVDRAIATRTCALSDAFVGYELVLTYAEVAKIGDYAALKVMVTAFGDASRSSSSSSGSSGSVSSTGPSSSSGSVPGSGSGSGGGSRGSGSGGIRDCATTINSLPDPLHMLFAATGVAACVNGTTALLMAYGSAFPRVFYADVPQPSGCAGSNGFSFGCDNTGWYLGVATSFGGCPGPVIEQRPTSETASPFTLTFVVPACLFVNATGHQSDTITITIFE